MRNKLVLIDGTQALKGHFKTDSFNWEFRALQPTQKVSLILSATGEIARLACTRIGDFGKDARAIVAQVGARTEQVFDDAIRLGCGQLGPLIVIVRRFRRCKR